jgi:hypothetical protein
MRAIDGARTAGRVASALGTVCCTVAQATWRPTSPITCCRRCHSASGLLPASGSPLPAPRPAPGRRRAAGPAPRHDGAAPAGRRNGGVGQRRGLGRRRNRPVFSGIVYPVSRHSSQEVCPFTRRFSQPTSEPALAARAAGEPPFVAGRHPGALAGVVRRGAAGARTRSLGAGQSGLHRGQVSAVGPGVGGSRRLGPG